jgi:hypothetical protein
MTIKMSHPDDNEHTVALLSLDKTHDDKQIYLQGLGAFATQTA